MRSFVALPSALLVLVAFAACSEEPRPSEPSAKPRPTAALRATVAGEEVAPSTLLPLGTRVVVHGDASQGQGELTYRWTLHRPALSEAKFEFEGEPKNAFTMDAGGTYTVELVVADGNGESEPARIELRSTYPAPTAALSLQAPEPTLALEHTVTADGSASTDPSGQPLTYVFRLTQRPVGSQTVLEVDGAKATFMPDRAGTYTVGLKVRNETTESEEVTESIVVAPPRNRPPVADAGPDFGAPLGVEVTLNGSRSTDPDGDELTFAWRFLDQPEGSAAEIVDADRVEATFLPEVEGVYEVELEVSDGEFTAKDTVLVTVRETPNRPPIIERVLYDSGKGLPPRPLPLVDAFETVEFGATVTLEVVAKDPDAGAVVEVRWDLVRPEGSSAEFVDVGPNKKSLTADVDGIYTVVLTANDGEFDSAPFTAKIRFMGDNRFPVAVLATEDGQIEYPNGSTVRLSGTQSYDTDEPPDALEVFDWKLVRRPSGAPGGFDRRGPSSTHQYRMERKGTYVFQLVVEDARGGVSEPAQVEVRSMNRPPVARADLEFSATLRNVDRNRLDDPDDPIHGSAVVLDAMRTFSPPSSDPDPEDSVLDFKWEIIDAPEGANPCLLITCVPVALQPAAGFYTDMPGVYRARLTVTDRDPVEPLSDTLEVTITITE